MERNAEKSQNQGDSRLEQMAFVATQRIGSFNSLFLHTLFFIGIFSLQWFGFSFDQIMLILTTAVSLEAIYLAIFIQMTVNRQAHKLDEVSEDIDDIQEDVEDISEDVEKGDENLSRRHDLNQEWVAHIEGILKTFCRRSGNSRTSISEKLKKTLRFQKGRPALFCFPRVSVKYDGLP